MHFHELHLTPSLLSAVEQQGYTEPTPIQQQAIPLVLAGGDVLGIAQTGTGKTAAFALPILQRLSAKPVPAGAHRPIRCLVLSPTRELAAQIAESFANYGKGTGLRQAVVFGGVGQRPQEDALRRGVDILVATPGRLIDLMQQGFVKYDKLEVFVLDEADRMLDMGFVHDVRRVVAKLPAKKQTLFFSATMPSEVQHLADGLLHNATRIEVTPETTTAEKIVQSVFFVEKADKRALLEGLLRRGDVRRVLVFTRTKHGANRLAEQLTKSSIPALAIHGNKSQNAREKALHGFKTGGTRVLVATDIAARGIDVEGITHVVNYELPNVPESYVHRIGRTARAGAEGVAWSLCDVEEREFLRDIEKMIRARVPVVEDHPFRSTVPFSAVRSPSSASSGQGRREPSRGGQSRGGPQRHAQPSRGGHSDGGPRGQARPSHSAGSSQAAPVRSHHADAPRAAGPVTHHVAPRPAPTASGAPRPAAGASSQQAAGSAAPRRRRRFGPG